MRIKITPGPIGGQVSVPVSKSHAHRLLICAALSQKETEVICDTPSNDILATAACLNTLCALVTRTADGFRVEPRAVADETCSLSCGESGATLRFLLPAACALGADARFLLEGRLPMRPMEPLVRALAEHGAAIAGQGTPVLSASGPLRGGQYLLPGNVSSQFVSGLIFALPLLKEDSVIEITGETESRGYIDMTVSAVRQFGIGISPEGNGFRIAGNQYYQSPGRVQAEGDWSSAAVWLCAAAACGRSIFCSGLQQASLQGDKAVCDILRRFGARVTIGEDSVSAEGGALRGISVDAGGIPDLVPAIAVAAAAAQGETVIENAGRLRYKESDRLQTVCLALKSLGAEAAETENGLIIEGSGALRGGTVDSCGDHRIAMMAAAASVICLHPVVIEHAEAVDKSYPKFFEDLEALGAAVEREEDRA